MTLPAVYGTVCIYLWPCLELISPFCTRCDPGWRLASTWYDLVDTGQGLVCTEYDRVCTYTTLSLPNATLPSMRCMASVSAYCGLCLYVIFPYLYPVWSCEQPHGSLSSFLSLRCVGFLFQVKLWSKLFFVSGYVVLYFWWLQSGFVAVCFALCYQRCD
jgi:hypothetical protein